jgi:hypothetical protein
LLLERVQLFYQLLTALPKYVRHGTGLAYPRGSILANPSSVSAHTAPAYGSASVQGSCYARLKWLCLRWRCPHRPQRYTCASQAPVESRLLNMLTPLFFQLSY